MSEAEVLQAGPETGGTIDGPIAEPAPAVAPVAPDERIEALDVLRGFAVLGILLMNVHDFGRPWDGHAELTPAGGATAADLAYWATIHVLFEGKMRATFSMLFGAGAVLLLSRAEARGGGLRVADVYYRRTLWLIVFGLIHAYFIWSGDILYAYGVVGLFLFPLRNASARTLVVAGLLLLAVEMPKAARNVHTLHRERAEAAEAERARAAGATLTDAQADAIDAWRERLEDDRPDAEEVAREVAEHLGGYLEVFSHRAKAVAEYQSTGFYRNDVFDVGGMVLLGMGLLKLGLLTGRRGVRTYLAMAALGYGIGVPLNAWTGYRLWASGFDLFVDAEIAVWYSPGRLSVALGHIGLIQALLAMGVLPGLWRLLAAVGRMALSNYLAASVICTLIFNGYGLGLYGELRSYQLLAVVAAVWALQLVVSPIWLRRYRFGPMEWLWRVLSHGTRQPLRLAR